MYSRIVLLCRTAARKFSVFPKVWEQAYFPTYFLIWDCVFQNTSDNNFNYITIILETQLEDIFEGIIY